MRRVIGIIGAGFGGLSAAVLLAARGHRVEVFDKQNRPGGKAAGIEINGFHFDSGPSVITSPWLFDEIFEKAGRKREDYIHLIPIHPWTRIIETNESWWDLDDPDLMNEDGVLITREEINQLSVFNENARTIFRRWQENYYNVTMNNTRDWIRSLVRLPEIRHLSDDYRLIASMLPNDRIRHAIAFPAVVLGANPFTPTRAPLIYHGMKCQGGVYYPQGGISALANSLVRIIRELGGEVHYGVEVSEILYHNGRLRGIRLNDGGVQVCDYVISTSDALLSSKDLLPGFARHFKSEVNKKRLATSAFVLGLGIRELPELELLKPFNIIQGYGFAEFMKSVFQTGKLSTDPFFFVNSPSQIDPSLAPAGHSLLQVVTPVPNLTYPLDWVESTRLIRKQLVDKLEQLFPGLRNAVVAEISYGPPDFRDRLNCYAGAAFSLQPIFTPTGWRTIKQQVDGYPEVFLVGAGTHPGGGIFGVIHSAFNVDRIITNRI